MISHFWKKIRAKSIAFWFIYIVILLYSVMNDLHFFDFTYADTGSYYEASGNPYAKMFYFTLKTAFAVLLYFFMNMISRGFTAVRNKNRDSRRRLIFVLIIMIVYIIFLILCWPGVWWCSGADEFKMVDFISHLQVQYHQGFMLSLFYFFAFMIYPNPVSVVILQMLLGSILLGTILADWWKNRHHISVVIIACIIFSPCGLYFALYPMRAYLTALFLIYFIYQYRNIRNRNSADKKEWIKLVITGCLVVNFRIEMMILIVVLPFLMWEKARMHDKKYLRLIGECVLILCLSVCCVSCWNKLGNQSNSMSHNLLSFTSPMGEIFARHYEEIDVEDLAILDQFFDISKMREEHLNPDNVLKYNGYERLNYPGASYAYTAGDCRQVKKTIAKLLLKYPDIYLQNKILLAKRTFGLDGEGDNKYRFPEEIRPERIAYLFKQIAPALADWIKNKLAGSFRIGKVRMFPVFYAMWVPFVLLLVDLIYALFRRNVKLIVLRIMVIMMFLAVFMTAMHPYTMYYFAPCMAAWFVLLPVSRDK